MSEAAFSEMDDAQLAEPERPVAALLTLEGRGAIATIVVTGSKALEYAGHRFTLATGGLLATIPVGRAVFGRFEISADAAEDLVIGVVSADHVEIHCHGGIAAARAILAALKAGGCTVVTAPTWVGLTSKDSLAAEALIALSRASTERTAAILLDQYHGALRRELDVIGQLLRDEAPQARDRFDQLLARADLGSHLTQPWKIAIAGPPNAGKSTLMNALAGYQRSIVYPEPGTTRDVLTATTAIDGWPVELADVAGLRVPADDIEASGIEAARAAIAQADLVLVVGDTTGPWDRKLLAETSGERPWYAAWTRWLTGPTTEVARRATLIVHNKCDIHGPPADGRPAGIEISALRGAGIDQLCQVISQRLVPVPPARGVAVPFSHRQIAALRSAAAALDENDWPEAGRRLRV